MHSTLVLQATLLAIVRASWHPTIRNSAAETLLPESQQNVLLQVCSAIVTIYIDSNPYICRLRDVCADRGSFGCCCIVSFQS